MSWTLSSAHSRYPFPFHGIVPKTHNSGTFIQLLNMTIYSWFTYIKNGGFHWCSIVFTRPCHHGISIRINMSQPRYPWINVKFRGADLIPGWWWLEHSWIMTFPSYWEYHHNWRTHIFRGVGIPDTHLRFSTWSWWQSGAVGEHPQAVGAAAIATMAWSWK